MKQENQRTIKLINKSFQLKLMTKLILLNVFILIIFGAILYLFLNSEVESNLSSAHVTYKNVSSMLFPIVLTLSLINILILSIIIMIVIMYASHKIAGPLFRVKFALEEISKKNLKPITSFREGDQIYEISTSLTTMIDVLTKDLNTINSGITEIKETISKAGKLPDNVQSKFAELETLIKEYNL